MKTNWTFTGDMNIAHGGMWLDMETYKQYGDFCPCVKVTPLDSAIGFEGAFMIESGSIYMNPKWRQRALECCGWSETDIQEIAYSFD